MKDQKNQETAKNSKSVVSLKLSEALQKKLNIIAAMSGVSRQDYIAGLVTPVIEKEFEKLKSKIIELG